MTRNWISAVILLVIMLSAVNAAPFTVYKRDLFLLHKRAVDLEPCDPASTIPLTGTADPDPVGGGKTKGNLKFVAGDAYAKLFLTYTTFDGPKALEGSAKTADLCASGLKCPVAKGQEIVITSPTGVADDADAPIIEYNVNDGETTIACGKTKAPAGGAAPPAGKEPPKGPDAGGDGGDEPPKEPPKGPDAGGDGGDEPPKEPPKGPEAGGDEPPKEPPKRK